MAELSVIIPTYNRMERLRACLEALAQQTQAPVDYEVIVVVDGSTDNTCAMLAELRMPYELRVIEQANQGQAVALNTGVAQARSRICLLLDDDILAEPSLITAHLQAHQGRNHTVALGQMTITIPDNADWMTQSFARSWREHYALLNSGEQAVTWRDAYSGNLSLPREMFMAVGGFATDLKRNYDIEFAYRLHRHNCEFRYIPAAVGNQDERKTGAQLLTDMERAGAADVSLYGRHPEMLPWLFGTFAGDSWRKLLLRRLIFGLRLSPRLLALAGPLLGKRRYSWYSFISNIAYWRGVQSAAPDSATWHQMTYGVPILMYHAFCQTTAEAGRYVMPVQRFARQMATLKRLGYRVISLDEYSEFRRHNHFPPARSVILTMDDGYRDNALALQVLERLGLKATVFFVSDYVGLDNHWDQTGELAGRELASWAEMRALLASGAVPGAHTRTHAALTTLSPEQAGAEISASRQALQASLETEINAFAYPYGDYDTSVANLVEQAGYGAACTVDPGLNTNVTSLMTLRRAEIYGTDSLLRFLFALFFGDAEAIFRRRSVSS